MSLIYKRIMFKVCFALFLSISIFPMPSQSELRDVQELYFQTFEKVKSMQEDDNWDRPEIEFRSTGTVVLVSFPFVNGGYGTGKIIIPVNNIPERRYLESIFVHELAHILTGRLANTEEDERRWTMIESGNARPLNQGELSLAIEYYRLSHQLGYFDLDQTQNLVYSLNPRSNRPGSFYHSMYTQIFSYASQSRLCGDQYEHDLRAIRLEIFNERNQSGIGLNSTYLNGDDIISFFDHTRRCLQNLRPLNYEQIHTATHQYQYNFDSEYVHSFMNDHHESFDSFEAYHHEIDENAFSNASNILDGLQNALRSKRERLREVINQLDTRSLRFRSIEDDADMFVMDYLRFHNLIPNHFIDFIIEGYPECRRYLENDTEPAYGNISNPYHTPCWRAWRNQSYFRHL